ncbi:Ewing's tumor-associated antigen 1 [Oryzias melastigma]|uniref:Ewing's tumor-associated antigen 1 n=1 Tax=Oryzias melastigma TaxID=30732 RepID=A0A834FHL1_ORYME|nr:Ewing's tumor-associated antigen 1 [Oryzias melastigma]
MIVDFPCSSLTVNAPPNGTLGGRKHGGTFELSFFGSPENLNPVPSRFSPAGPHDRGAGKVLLPAGTGNETAAREPPEPELQADRGGVPAGRRRSGMVQLRTSHRIQDSHQDSQTQTGGFQRRVSSQRLGLPAGHRLGRRLTVASATRPENREAVQRNRQHLPDRQQDRPRGRCCRVGCVHAFVHLSNSASVQHGRPRTSEPSLQQWIGDSASIPCTPEVPAARTSRKSPRTSTEVLLKLAQQFDQNLFHQEEGLLSDQNPFHQEEGLPPDQNPDYSDHEDSTPAWNAVTDCDQQLENDLDFLFDGPTQSSSLSPVLVLPTEPPELQPAAPTTAAVSTATSRTSSAREPFEDDWDNDDILNDTLVLEMTQNPLKFLTPQLCSTQNPLNQGNAAGPGPRAGKENTRPRTSFRLDRIAGSSERRSKKFWSSEPSGSVACQQRSPETRSVFTWQKCRPITTIPELQGPGPIVQKNPDLLSSQSNPTDVDFLDEDLDSLFSSEPVWDDPADDDLLCGVCDELENQIQNQQRAVLQLTRSAFDNQIQTSGAALTRTAPALTGRGSVSPWQHENSRGAVSMTTGTSGGKCSAAEIELKKQQAVERRRRRLQAAQNLQTQT